MLPSNSVTYLPYDTLRHAIPFRQFSRVNRWYLQTCATNLIDFYVVEFRLSMLHTLMLWWWWNLYTTVEVAI